MESTASQDIKKRFYVNNFDLIRLFAAIQVVHVHLVTILGVQVFDAHRVLLKFFGFFPGVPIFFFISGFLITKSWANSKGLHDFFKKRALRIFPALVFSVALALFLIVASGYYSAANMSLIDLLAILIAKSTIFQVYNPESLRGYGDGVLNGSLWTITVELQFYILTPIVFILLHRIRRNFSFNQCLVCLFLVFYLTSIFLKYGFFSGHSSIIEKIVRISFLPWFYMFLLGALFQIYFDFFYKWLSGKFLWLLIIYAGISAVLLLVFKVSNSNFGNLMNPILFPLLASLIFSAAYTKVDLSERVLHGNDISYGAYIYHMPFINWLIYHGFSSSYFVAGSLFLFIIVFSALSWFFLERPFLRLK